MSNTLRVKVYIDGTYVECVEQPEVVISYDAELTRSVEKARDGRMVELQMAVNGRNESIFAGEGYLHARERFNATEHTAQIYYDGEVVIEGSATLRALVRDGEVSRYTLLVAWASGVWAEMAATQLISILPIEYSIYLRQPDIIAAWSDTSLPIQFFPVHRDDYESEASSVSLEVVRHLRTIDDYHPFLNIGDMVRATAEQAGYTIQSSIMESEGFKTLYMSGAYEGQQNDVAKAAMDFKVKKSTAETATADYMGRVTISPYIISNAISSIVDIESIDEDSACFETNDCLSEEDGAVVFTPTTSVSVGFEYRLRYVTDYKIESRYKLTGFDTFYLGEAPTVEVDITNNFTDERDGVIYSGMEYLAIVFDHTDGASYRIVGRVDGASSTSVLASWSDRTVRFTPSFSTSLTDLSVEVLSGSSYVALGDDWALYQGYVTETGQTELDLTIRTSPDSYTPTSPKSFGTIFFEGAEEGMSLTLLAETTITPYFSGYPGYGEEVFFEDLSRHEERQDTLLESVLHLFNLRFFIDERAKVIHIDPLDDIYDGSTLWDWSSRVVKGEAITFEDCALDVTRCRTWGYQDGDGVTNRMSGFYYVPGEDYPDSPEAEPTQFDTEAISPEYGAWQRSISNYASVDSEGSELNPLFSPSQSTLSDVLIVGDRDDEEIVDTLEFTPRIVRWCGTNDDGEPSASFHNATAGHTLCFEDRDSIAGLNQYYASQIEMEERCQYATVSITLSPNEMVALFSVVEGMPSLLSTFILTLQGERAECRIEAIEEYKFGDEIAKIKFIIIK